MSLTPGTRLGPYEITAQIDVGGMGEVYNIEPNLNTNREQRTKNGELRFTVALVLQ